MDLHQYFCINRTSYAFFFFALPPSREYESVFFKKHLTTTTVIIDDEDEDNVEGESDILEVDEEVEIIEDEEPAKLSQKTCESTKEWNFCQKCSNPRNLQ